MDSSYFPVEYINPHLAPQLCKETLDWYRHHPQDVTLFLCTACASVYSVLLRNLFAIWASSQVKSSQVIQVKFSSQASLAAEDSSSGVVVSVTQYALTVVIYPFIVVLSPSVITQHPFIVVLCFAIIISAYVNIDQPLAIIV